MQDGGIPHPALETSARERQLFPDIPEVGLVCSYGTRSVRRARQIVNRPPNRTIGLGAAAFLGTHRAPLQGDLVARIAGRGSLALRVVSGNPSGDATPTLLVGESMGEDATPD
jgi:hypothetical protein